MNSKLIDFNGTVISAQEIDWCKLNRINDKAEKFMDYLGNYFADDSTDVYALFAMDDNADRKKFCVRID